MQKIVPFILNSIPRPLLIRLSYLFMPVSRWLYKGNKVECPICLSRFSHFLPYGYHQPRQNALCQGCLSLERHRLLWLYLKERTCFFTDQLKVLHIAPEQCFIRRLRKMNNLTYTTADLESPLADIRFDVQKIPLANNSFDMVICNHVLEHVEDDHQALNEIYRILKPGGMAILQVPTLMGMRQTYEDPDITTPEERLKHFHQKDHYRIYGADFPVRVNKVGFEVKEKNFLDSLSESTLARYRLPADEYMFGYRKPME